MPVKKKITLDGNSLHSLDNVYDEISRQLSLPENFGHNLDALWDILSTDVEGPFEILWRCSDTSRKTFGERVRFPDCAYAGS